MELLNQTLGSPWVYAALIYVSFRFLDGQVSSEAQLAISSILQRKEFDHKAAGTAIVELFDRIYTSRLLSRRAFIRSAFFTLVASAIFLYETYPRDHPFL